MATASIDRVVSWIAGYYPTVTFQVDSCRKVSGTSTWSQHAYGNAVDVFGDVAVLDEIYHRITKLRGQLGISVICWKSYGPCSAADHQDHIHIAGSPRLSGTPKCAGGTVGDDATGTPSGGGSSDVPSGGSSGGGVEIPAWISPGGWLAGKLASGDASPLDLAGGFLTDPGWWRRIAYVVVGLAVILVGLVILYTTVLRNGATSVASSVLESS